MSNKKRNFAIIHRTDDLEYIGKLESKLISVSKKFMDSQIYVFHVHGAKMPETRTDSVKYVELPNDILGKEVPKIMNYVFRYFKVEHVSEGMLYLFDECVEIVEDKFLQFIIPIENMMELMGHRVWLSTTADQCNYNFDKYDGRCVLKIDIPEFEKISKNDIIFASNANFDFSIYDLDNIDLSEMLIDEQFTIGMFFILEFLAKRRAANIPGCFMNLYPTVSQEIGILKTRTIKEEQSMEMEGGEEEFKRQRQLFDALKLDTNPTIKVEYAAAFVCNKYLKKLEAIDPEAAKKLVSGFAKIEEAEEKKEEKVEDGQVRQDS